MMLRRPFLLVLALAAGTFDDAAVDAAGRRKNRRQQSKAPYDCEGGACERFDYCVVGAGAAGLQVGALFEKAERSYVVLERAGDAGSFFRKFPIHRQLISINKRNTGRGGSPLALEHNLRHDWHSLLTSANSAEVDPELLFGRWSNKFYPHADELVDYLEAWGRAMNVNVRYNTEVRAIRDLPTRSGGGGYRFQLEIDPSAARAAEPSSQELTTVTFSAEQTGSLGMDLSLERSASAVGGGMALKIRGMVPRSHAEDSGQLQAGMVLVRAGDVLLTAPTQEDLTQLVVKELAKRPVTVTFAPPEVGGDAPGSDDPAWEAPPIECKYTVVATGLHKVHAPEIPGIEHTMSYADVPTDGSYWFNKSVAVIGAGNAGFETAAIAMEEAAYVHIHSGNDLRFAWETHYVGDLRAINTLPIDNYQLKSQDVLFTPGPIVFDTAVIEKQMHDGVEKTCLRDQNQALLDSWMEEGVPPAIEKQNSDTGHSMSFADRLRDGKRFCYDDVVRATGFELNTTIFDLRYPLKQTGGHYGRKYAALTPEYESENIPGLFFIGTLGHVLDWRKSSGGFLHGFRYTARAAFKILESKNLGLPWPSTTVPMPGGEVDALQHKLTDRMDSSSGLYQMFAFLSDAVILPERGSDGAAEYLEEVPLAMISDMAKGREYLTLTMEYGPDFHGHERVFARSRVFHRDDPAQGYKSQFLHPVLRYFVPGTQNEMSAHHTLEDIYTDFQKEASHQRPIREWLERFQDAPLTRADAPLDTSWPDDIEKATEKQMTSIDGVNWIAL